MKVTRYTNDNGFFEMLLKWFHFCMICFFSGNECVYSEIVYS